MTNQDNELLHVVMRIEKLIEQGINADRPMNIKEASEFLGLSVSYVYTLCNQKKLCHYKPNGKKIYFLRQDLLDFMTRNKVSSESQVNDKAMEYINRSR